MAGYKKRETGEKRKKEEMIEYLLYIINKNLKMKDNYLRIQGLLKYNSKIPRLDEGKFFAFYEFNEKYIEDNLKNIINLENGEKMLDLIEDIKSINKTAAIVYRNFPEKNKVLNKIELYIKSNENRNNNRVMHLLKMVDEVSNLIKEYIFFLRGEENRVKQLKNRVENRYENFIESQKKEFFICISEEKIQKLKNKDLNVSSKETLFFLGDLLIDLVDELRMSLQYIEETSETKYFEDELLRMSIFDSQLKRRSLNIEKELMDVRNQL